MKKVIDQVTTIKVNKIEAAQRQIDAAIRLLFDSEDPIAIHTLTMAGFRILRDIAEKQKCPITMLFKSFIQPGMEGKFWGSLQTLANFLKHAKKDPEGIIENIQEEVNDSIILLASLYYQGLGYQFTPEMLALIGWYSAIHPDFIRDDAFQNILKKLESLQDNLSGKTRQEQLVEGKEVLDIARPFLRK
ncbi:MAG TPA: hypothetical protein VJ974_08940 [Geopsychrobacteraceae bacterium]|nr:hypothetical protein [Geopsychrobacteraceae bacterium]